MNKRPLVMVSLSFLIGLFLSGYSSILGIGLLLVLEIGLMLTRGRENRISVFYLILPLIAYAGMVYGGYYENSISLDTKISEKEVVTLEGRVYKRETKNNRDIIYIKCNSKNNILVYQKTDTIYLIGNTIRVTGKLNTWEKPRNEGQFDLSAYYRLENITYRIEADSILLLNDDYSPYREFLEGFRQKMKKSYESILNEKEASILSAMVLGENNQLDMTTKQLYQKNGISHILVISGLHISFIGMVVYGFFRKAGLSFLQAGIIGILFIISYGIMTGIGTSTARALVMFTISVGANILGRTYDVLTSLFLAAVLILIENPLYLTNAGFLLSFGAILGIVLVGTSIEEAFSKKALLLKGIYANLGINLVTTPILLYFFYELPIYSILVNLLIVPLSTVLLLAGFAGGLFGMMHSGIGTFAIASCHYILNLYEAICEFFLKLPGAIYISGRPEGWQVMVYVLLLLTMVFLLKKEKGKLYLCIIFIMIEVITFPVKKDMEVTFIDVGQGDSIYIRTPKNNHYLVDGGSVNVNQVGKYRIIPFLKYNGVRSLEYVFVTHADKDHVSGIIELIEASKEGGIKIKNLLLPHIEEKDDSYYELEEVAKVYNILTSYIKKGDKIQEGEVTISCLHPEKNYITSDRNEYSTVLNLDYREFELLLTGDIEGNGETALLQGEDLKEVDVLKVAHHGSRFATSPEFLKAANPFIAVISCGQNNSFGHPHEELIERLKEQGSKIYVTKDLGGITIETDGVRLEIFSYLSQQ